MKLDIVQRVITDRCSLTRPRKEKYKHIVPNQIKIDSWFNSWSDVPEGWNAGVIPLRFSVPAKKTKPLTSIIDELAYCLVDAHPDSSWNRYLMKDVAYTDEFALINEARGLAAFIIKGKESGIMIPPSLPRSDPGWLPFYFMPTFKYRDDAIYTIKLVREKNGLMAKGQLVTFGAHKSYQNQEAYKSIYNSISDSDHTGFELTNLEENKITFTHLTRQGKSEVEKSIDWF